jgi:hypothetical protein
MYRSLLVCALADIIGKPEVLIRFEEYLTQETNFYTVLVEKMLQFKLSAPHFPGIPGGDSQNFTPINSPRAYCYIRPRTG